jgi:DNA repair photolyase
MYFVLKKYPIRKVKDITKICETKMLMLRISTKKIMRNNEIIILNEYKTKNLINSFNISLIGVLNT